jgi:hypothetical protein
MTQHIGPLFSEFSQTWQVKVKKIKKKLKW